MKNILYINYQIINLIIMRKVKSQTILLYWVNGKKFHNKKTQKL